MVKSPRRYGQKPGSMHIDKRAGRLLASHVSEGPDDELLPTKRVAEWLECCEQFLEIQRCRGTGPNFVPISPRKIMYRRGAVREWLRRRERMRTAGYSKKAAAR